MTKVAEWERYEFIHEWWIADSVSKHFYAKMLGFYRTFLKNLSVIRFRIAFLD